MFSLCRNISDIPVKYFTIKNIPSFFKKSAFIINKIHRRQNSSLLLKNLSNTNSNFQLALKHTSNNYIESKRYFSKKKGSKKRTVEEDEESESDEEEYEPSVDEDEIGDTVITRQVPSMRFDNILKAGLGLTKKKIEQEFYAFKLRINGKPSVKKSENVHVGDELDLIKGFSPDTSKYLSVDRVIIKGVDKISGSGKIPVKMEVLKGLTIENYEEPWHPSYLGETEK